MRNGTLTLSCCGSRASDVPFRPEADGADHPYFYGLYAVFLLASQRHYRPSNNQTMIRQYAGDLQR